jgi:hypothetical protein
MYLREQRPRSNPGPYFYGCEFASSEQSPGLPPCLMQARNNHGSTYEPSHSRSHSRLLGFDDAGRAGI